VAAEPVPLIEPSETPVDVTPAAPTEAEPVYATSDPGAVETTATAQPVSEPVPVAQSQHVVYVEAPRPPAKKGNRGFGVLLAIVSAVIYAVLFALITVIVDVANSTAVDFTFISTADFWVPVLVFLIGFIILVLIVNRAGWIAHVIGSLFVGAFVFFASSAAILLFHLSEFTPAQAGAAYHSVLFSPVAIVAALLAREVSLWMGAAIAARGRRVKVRNVEARETYERDEATKRAEYERANAAHRDVAPTETTVPVADEVPAS
jgi:uncharacterized integral membrane protein